MNEICFTRKQKEKLQNLSKNILSTYFFYSQNFIPDWQETFLSQIENN